MMGVLWLILTPVLPFWSYFRVGGYTTRTREYGGSQRSVCPSESATGHSRPILYVGLKFLENWDPNFVVETIHVNVNVMECFVSIRCTAND